MFVTQRDHRHTQMTDQYLQTFHPLVRESYYELVGMILEKWKTVDYISWK